MSDQCCICQAYEGYGLDGLHVQECDNCGCNVCENCAEVDYDMQGDPPQYVNTQWQCEGGCETELDHLTQVDQRIDREDMLGGYE